MAGIGVGPRGDGGWEILSGVSSASISYFCVGCVVVSAYSVGEGGEGRSVVLGVLMSSEEVQWCCVSRVGRGVSLPLARFTRGNKKRNNQVLSPLPTPPLTSPPS